MELGLQKLYWGIGAVKGKASKQKQCGVITLGVVLMSKCKYCSNMWNWVAERNCAQVSWLSSPLSEILVAAQIP